MDFVQVKGNTWCLKGTGLMTVYRLDDRRCILLDSGFCWEQDDLKETLAREGLLPIGAIGSHTHIDHVGNHRWLRETYGARTCLSAGEAAIAADPNMCKLLYCGLSVGTAMAFAECLFFPVDQILGPEDGTVEFMGVPFRIHHTPGHTQDHICIGTPDGVCHVGDLLLTGEMLKGAQLPYNLVHKLARESMEKMRNTAGYDFYIASHRDILEDFSSAVDANLQKLDWVCEQILTLAEKPVTWDQMMMKVLERNHLYTKEERKAVSYERVTQCFVDYLKDTGKLSIHVERGIRHFKRI